MNTIETKEKTDWTRDKFILFDILLVGSLFDYLGWVGPNNVESLFLIAAGGFMIGFVCISFGTRGNN